MSTREPLAIRAAVVAVLNAVIGVLVAFGVDLTDEQTTALLTLVSVASILAVVLWSRGKVTPTADPQVPAITDRLDELEAAITEPPATVELTAEPSPAGEGPSTSTMPADFLGGAPDS